MCRIVGNGPVASGTASHPWIGCPPAEGKLIDRHGRQRGTSGAGRSVRAGSPVAPSSAITCGGGGGGSPRAGGVAPGGKEGRGEGAGGGGRGRRPGARPAGGGGGGASGGEGP